ncbi:unnamed protein product, partial [Nesidiocoris tenuis]
MPKFLAPRVWCISPETSCTTTDSECRSAGHKVKAKGLMLCCQAGPPAPTSLLAEDFAVQDWFWLFSLAEQVSDAGWPILWTFRQRGLLG